MDLGGKRPGPQEKWTPGSLCCAKLTTSWISCLSSSSAVTQIFSLYWGREGVVTSQPCPERFPSSFSHQSYPDQPSRSSEAVSCRLASFWGVGGSPRVVPVQPPAPIYYCPEILVTSPPRGLLLLLWLPAFSLPLPTAPSSCWSLI